ncbi:hypothetical protein KFK09_017752 [Dendrobium nobile]|uniref:Uncharacterized protein n=1 Tax=Dendrobium nobile TaxID=94219 RepID=A0A8T3ASD2_DENNO|nr:hypothetical protein KFK09_017752 [Dendrobium nobile]
MYHIIGKGEQHPIISDHNRGHEHNHLLSNHRNALRREKEENLEGLWALGV